MKGMLLRFSPRLGATLLALALLAPVSRAEETVASGPVRIVEVKPIKLPWNSTRASWERTKDVATTNWKMIPFAQVATVALFMQTALSAPYDVLASPFRQKSRNEVRFEVRGRIVDADGKPAPQAKVLARCAAPFAKDGDDEPDYYETGRFGPVVTDADGRVRLEGSAPTGVDSTFMIHLDLQDTPSGSGSGGAYRVSVSSAGAKVSPTLSGSWKLVPDRTEAAAAPADPAASAKP